MCVYACACVCVCIFLFFFFFFFFFFFVIASGVVGAVGVGGVTIRGVAVYCVDDGIVCAVGVCVGVIAAVDVVILVL